MFLIQKLKAIEKQIVLLRWASGEAVGKINYVGNDFVELNVINDDHKFGETILLRQALILEVIVGGTKLGQIIAEISHNLTTQE